MNIKKLVRTSTAIFLAAVMMAGCSTSQSETTTASQNQTTTEASTADAVVPVEDNSTASSAAADSIAAPKELRKIDLVLDWYPNAIHAFIYDAIDKGYYAEEGLEVNLQVPTGTNDALSLVAAGRAQIGFYYQLDLIQARGKNSVPVKSIGAIVQNSLNTIISLKKNGILSPKDLAGKTIGYSGSDLSEAILKSMMEADGAAVTDVTLVDVGFDLMSSLTTGKVDATSGCLVNHEVPQLQEEGFDINYFMDDDYGVPRNYQGIFLASDKMIEDDPEMLAAFLRASKRGFEDVKADPEATLQLLLSHQDAANFPLSETVERKSMEILLPMMETEDAEFLSQSDEIWQKNIDWQVEMGLIDQPLTLDDVRVNLEF